MKKSFIIIALIATLFAQTLNAKEIRSMFGFYLDYMYLEDLNEPLVNIHIYRNETRFFDRLTSEW